MLHYNFSVGCLVAKIKYLYILSLLVACHCRDGVALTCQVSRSSEGILSLVNCFYLTEEFSYWGSAKLRCTSIKSMQ